MTSPDCDKKAKAPVWMKIFLPVLVLTLIIAIYFAITNATSATSPAAPSPISASTPSPTATPQPIPTPIPKPVFRGYKYYGLAKNLEYPDFVSGYNTSIEWYLNERSVTDVDLSLKNNRETIKSDPQVSHYTDTQVLLPGMSLSITVADYFLHITGVEYISEGADIETNMDIIAAVICAVDRAGFEDTVNHLDIWGTIRDQSARTAITNGITYSLESGNDGVRFSVNLYESDATPSPTQKSGSSDQTGSSGDPVVAYLNDTIRIHGIISDATGGLDVLKQQMLNDQSVTLDPAWVSNYINYANTIKSACSEMLNYTESKVPAEYRDIHAEDKEASRLMYESMDLAINSLSMPLSQESVDMMNRSTELFNQSLTHTEAAIALHEELLRSQGIIK